MAGRKKLDEEARKTSNEMKKRNRNEKRTIINLCFFHYPCPLRVICSCPKLCPHTNTLMSCISSLTVDASLVAVGL
jgi:hypothetical protein